ncbi:hypothetical protein I5F00_17425 [Proteus mirabilis]|uniref:hypothetical protein n=1 Tax=Proteus mirabilis TaxID=584 RepID=UPI0018C5093F|nr:hypothetical protein [Proteus mirabilis]
MPLIPLIILAIVGLFKFLLKKIIWAGWRFYLFLAFWISLYLVLITQTSEWLSLLLKSQPIFSSQIWITGISLLPANASFCLFIISSAYALFWVLSFKRQISAKYKDSTDGK